MRGSPDAEGRRHTQLPPASRGDPVCLEMRKPRSFILVAAASVALLWGLTSCGPAAPLAPVTESDPLALSGTSIDLRYASGADRFAGSLPGNAFPDLPSGLLPPFSPSSYTLTLSVVGATLTNASTFPSTLTLSDPVASLTLSDAKAPSVSLSALTTSGSWTFDGTGGGAYTVSGNAELTITVTDPSTLAAIVQLLTNGSDNQVAGQLGANVAAVPQGATLTLEFGAGTETFDFSS